MKKILLLMILLSPVAHASPLGMYALFDGTDDRLNIPTTGMSDDTFSYSLWIKADNDNTGSRNDQVFIARNVGGLNGCHQITYLFSGNPANNYIRYKGQSGGDLADYVDLGDTWHHIAATNDPSGNVSEIYVDGVLFDSDIALDCVQTTNPGLFLGGLPYNPQTNDFSGQIDDLAVYYDVLTGPEILAIYNDGILGNPNTHTDNRHVYLDFECIGLDETTVWDDKSGNGYDPSLIDSPYVNQFCGAQTVTEPSWSYDLYDSAGNPISGTIAEAEVVIQSGIDPKVVFTADGAVDLTGVTVQSDAYSTVVSGLESAPGVYGDHDVYVPNVNGIGVYVCPNAVTISEISPGCADVVSWTDAECNGLTARNIGSDKVYCTKENGDYLVLGLANSGVTNNGEDPMADNVIPEFSTIGMVLALLIVFLGTVYVVKKK